MPCSLIVLYLGTEASNNLEKGSEHLEICKQAAKSCLCNRKPSSCEWLRDDTEAISGIQLREVPCLQNEFRCFCDKILVDS